MSYNPMDAPEREPLKFKDYVKCVSDEIITVQEAVNRGRMQQVPDRVDPNEPYWDLAYVALDTKRHDGTDFFVAAGGRLFTRREDGTYRQADRTQRPSQNSAAFAKLGINVFPGDPEGKFDAWCSSHGMEPIGANPAFEQSRVIGNCFVVEKKAPNRDDPKDPARFAAQIPTVELGPNYTYVGDVRVFSAPGGNTMNENGAVAPSPASYIDILTDETARAQVIAAITGKQETALDDALMAAGIGHNLQVGGESVLAAAVTGKLASVLSEFITVDGGVVTAKS